jgi:calcium-dependent protein kinase
VKRKEGKGFPTTYHQLMTLKLLQRKPCALGLSRKTRYVVAFVPHNELYRTRDAPITHFGFSSTFVDEYEVGKRLGAGTFGTVYEASHRKTGQKFAVKRMPKRFSTENKLELERYFVRRVRNEVDICNHLGRSLNVAYLYGAYEDDVNVDLVMELCTGGELWDAIQRRGGAYNELDAARLVREIVRTVAQCHAAGVLIRDIKPENFLFASPAPDAPLKAIDFGISVFCEPGQEVDVRAGTPIFIAPEVLRCRYSFPADMWSVGIVAYMLLTGRLPFTGEEGAEVASLYMTSHVYNNKDVFRAVLYADLDFERPPWDVVSAEALDFVKCLLSRNPEDRLTASSALSHPWLKLMATGDEGNIVELGDSIVQRLQRYGTFGMLKQAALRKVAKAFVVNKRTPGSNINLFQELGLPASHLSLEDLKLELCRKGHFNLSEPEAEQLLAQLEPDAVTGMVDVDAWAAAMADWSVVRDSAEWDVLVADVFREADRDDDRRLGTKDLERLMCGEEGCHVPDMVDAALRDGDGDYDGGISLKEFKELLSSEHEGDLALFNPRLSMDSRDDDEGLTV